MACLRHATCLRHVSPKFRSPTYKYLPTPMSLPKQKYVSVCIEIKLTVVIKLQNTKILSVSLFNNNGQLSIKVLIFQRV